VTSRARDSFAWKDPRGWHRVNVLSLVGIVFLSGTKIEIVSSYVYPVVSNSTIRSPRRTSLAHVGLLLASLLQFHGEIVCSRPIAYTTAESLRDPGASNDRSVHPQRRIDDRGNDGMAMHFRLP